MSNIQKAPQPQQAAQIKHARAPRLTISITPEIIAEAVKRHSGHCVIADALKAAVPDAQNISVDVQTIRYSDPRLRRRYTYLTPRRGQLAVVQFDQGVRPEPFAITLRGGAVTKMGDTSSKGRNPSDANGAQGPTTRKQLIRTGSSDVAETIGGKTPPIAALAHAPRAAKRREFGMRAFQM